MYPSGWSLAANTWLVCPGTRARSPLRFGALLAVVTTQIANTPIAASTPAGQQPATEQHRPADGVGVFAASPLSFASRHLKGASRQATIAGAGVLARVA